METGYYPFSKEDQFYIRLQQVINKTKHDVITSAISDFQITDYTFEVGGKNKKQKQLQGIENGFIVKDDIEQGYMNVIPLWQFGLTY